MADVTIDIRQLTSLGEVFRRASRAGVGQILDEVGQAAEDGARERISDTKESPDGEKWKAWSERYAKTRHGGNSLLQSEGGLLDSLTHNVGSDFTMAGSNLVYASRQFFGDDEGPGSIPSRQALGIGEHEREAFGDIVEHWAAELF